MFTKVVFGTAVVLVLALTGCGDGGPPDAAKVYAEASEKMAALTAYHVTVESSTAGGFELDFVAPDRYRLFPGEDGFGWVGIGDQFYIKSPDSPDDFISPEFFNDPDFVGLLTALTTEISNLTYVAKEEVDGISTHHLQGTLQPEVLALVEFGDAPPEAITVEVWVGVEDSLVRRYRWEKPDETITHTLSRFNDEAISVAAPPNPRPPEEALPFFLPDVTEVFETPEQVKEEIESASPEEQDCLRRALGDAVFEELKAGTRLPTQEEFKTINVECPEESGQ